MTATDLVLTVAQLLRQRRVVGKFVDYGPGVANVPLANRVVLGNMPEYGSTCAIFPLIKHSMPPAALAAVPASNPAPTVRRCSSQAQKQPTSVRYPKANPNEPLAP